MTAANRDGEPNRLCQHVYINEEQSLLTLRHTQKDSDALLFLDDRFSKAGLYLKSCNTSAALSWCIRAKFAKKPENERQTLTVKQFI